MLHGVAVSPGVIVGRVYKIESILHMTESVALESAEQVSPEIDRFDRAIVQAGLELESMIQKVESQIGREEAAIFRSHLTMVRDPGLRQKVHSLIEGQQITAMSALQGVLKQYVSRFENFEQQDYFRERLADLRDVFGRIAADLIGISQQYHSGRLPEGGDDPIVIVAHEILPSQSLALGDQKIGGIVTEIGGGTSHASILSRSRGIPAVTGVANITHEVANGDLIVVDGREGHVLLHPDAETTAAYRKLQREFFTIKDKLIANRDQPAVSADGTPVELLANINSVTDAANAARTGAMGVGLLRTEYIFLTHPDVPDEEEQYRHYREIVEAMNGLPVTIRTLDVGGDKSVPYLGRRVEANPFMGWRSIRLAFEHPKLYETQIRAILRAGAHGRVSMLFPMVTTLEELRFLNRMVENCKSALAAEGLPFGREVRTGVMIEVPAAAICVDALLRETQFISIGSNDLVQYLMAADRDNSKVSHLCEPLSPAVIKVLNLVFESSRKSGVPVTLCGEMAAQPRSFLVLFGLGLRKFSMSPAFVPAIKNLLSQVTTSQAERFAHHVLQFKTSEEIRHYMSDRLNEIAADLQLFDISN
ncbi:MAG: phosphoenolpyruvate--protein phosphotransferase [bacterium]